MPGSSRAKPTRGCRRPRTTGSRPCVGRRGSMRHPHRLRLRLHLRPRSAELARAALGAAAVLLAQSALAQSRDVPPPPRLDPAPLVFQITPKDIADKPVDPSKLSAAQLASTAAPARPPNAAVLAPRTEGRGNT